MSTLIFLLVSLLSVAGQFCIVGGICILISGKYKSSESNSRIEKFLNNNHSRKHKIFRGALSIIIGCALLFGVNRYAKVMTEEANKHQNSVIK